MSDFTPEQLARLAGDGLQRSIAKDVWPNGATLSCLACGQRLVITSWQCGKYLASGWPKHCGATMRCEARAPGETGAA